MNGKERAMFDLKPLSKEAIPAAIDKAMRYRLLNEPGEVESICLDVLQTDPHNQTRFALLRRTVSQGLRGQRHRFTKRSPDCTTNMNAFTMRELFERRAKPG
jgi:hypothetical protein